MPYPHVMTVSGSTGPVTLTLPNTVSSSCQYEFKITNTTESETETMSNATKTVAHDVVYTDGTSERIASTAQRACDGLITLVNDRVEAAVLNQDQVRKVTPVAEDEAPALVVGKYTYEVSLAGGESATVAADSFEIVNRTDKDGGVYRFHTMLPSNAVRYEATFPVANVLKVERVEAPAVSA